MVRSGCTRGEYGGKGYEKEERGGRGSLRGEATVVLQA